MEKKFSGEWKKVGKVVAFQNNEEVTIINLDGGRWFALGQGFDADPRIADDVQIYSYSGNDISGVMFNEKVLFQKNDAEIEIERQVAIEEQNLKLLNRFNEVKDTLDHVYSLLPHHFQKKIERLRSKNINFRMRFEETEMVLLSDAIKLVDVCRTPEGIEVFAEKSTEARARMVPGLSSLAGQNQRQLAMHMAVLAMKCPEIIQFTHGFCADRIGCEEFGCHPLSKEEQEYANQFIPEEGHGQGQK